MINSQRLSKIISDRECNNTTDRLIEMYDKLSVAQRLEIKLMLNRIKNEYSNNNK
jgi:hypothetical protein